MKKSILNIGRALSKEAQRTINGGGPNDIESIYGPHECSMCTDGHRCYYDVDGNGYCTAETDD
ncbi:MULTISPECIES: hypothetical protein [Aquimarina]|uniref:hypothetical protein n=1 Tax=Aquimarina TaxID=290174 RepID=UPI000941CF8D|nr:MULTISPECIES: hypothetical protein [Aquimarina]